MSSRELTRRTRELATYPTRFARQRRVVGALLSKYGTSGIEAANGVILRALFDLFALKEYNAASDLQLATAWLYIDMNRAQEAKEA